MASNDEQKPVELKVEEVGVLQEKEQPEEEEEEEIEQNEEEEQNEPNKNNKNEEQQENDNNDEEEGEEEGPQEIRLVKQDDGDDENKQTAEHQLDNELKVNVEWYITGNNDVDIVFKTLSKRKLWLHWGVSQGNDGNNWSRIDKSYYPALTNEFNDFALQTEFSFLNEDDLEQKVHIRFPKGHVHTFNYVFLEKEQDRWYNNNKQDYHLNIN
jgi:hypothetical protein